MVLPRPPVLGTDDVGDLVECWACAGLSVLLLVLRFAVRLRIEGVRGARMDDWLCIPYVILHIANISVFQITYYQGATKVLTPEFVGGLNDYEADVLSRAARVQFICWYTYPTNLWTLKFIALFFYRRLTLNTWHTRTLYFLFWVSGLTLLSILLVITLICLPYSHNWQIRPYTGPTCTYHLPSFWTMFSFNVLTDIAILMIPISMLIHFRASWLRKFFVGALLFAFYTRWGSREIIVGHAAICVPVLRPLISRAFWRLGPYQRDDPINAVELSEQKQSGHGVGGSGAASDLEGGAARKKPAISWESRAMWSIIERDNVADKDLSIHDNENEDEVENEDNPPRSSRSSAQFTRQIPVSTQTNME